METSSLKQLEKVKAIATKEKRAKEKFLKELSKLKCAKGKKVLGEKQGNRPLTETEKEMNDDDVCCEACNMTYKEDEEMGLGRVWVACDLCIQNI